MSHRSGPDLSRHLPAPAFSPFDACLLPFHFPLYLSSVHGAIGSDASGTASLSSRHCVQSRHKQLQMLAEKATMSSKKLSFKKNLNEGPDIP
jgi:hypothetical protein